MRRLVDSTFLKEMREDISKVMNYDEIEELHIRQKRTDGSVVEL